MSELMTMERLVPRDDAARLDGAMAAASPATRIDSRALFGARNVLTIRHAEQDYTLRITRNGKLILTK